MIEINLKEQNIKTMEAPPSMFISAQHVTVSMKTHTLMVKAVGERLTMKAFQHPD